MRQNYSKSERGVERLDISLNPTVDVYIGWRGSSLFYNNLYNKCIVAERGITSAAYETWILQLENKSIESRGIIC